MVEKMIKLILTFVGLCVGVGVGIHLSDFLSDYNAFNLNLHSMVYKTITPIFLGLIFGMVSYVTSRLVIKLGKKLANYAQSELEKIPQIDMIFGQIGRAHV